MITLTRALDTDLVSPASRPAVGHIGLDGRTADAERGNSSFGGVGVPLERIVVATDFSSHSAYVVDRAVALVDKLPVSRVIVAHVMPESLMTAIGLHFMNSFSGNDSRDEGPAYMLREIADDLRARTGAIVDTRLESGHCVQTLQQLAPEADLMILGATDCHSICNAVFGSTAGRLLGKARQPLLVVRRRGDTPYRRVLIAVDLETDARNALLYAQKVASHKKLDLIHVCRVPYEGHMKSSGLGKGSIAKLRTHARHAAAMRMTDLVLSHLPSGEARVLLANGYVVPKILQKARELAVDLIVVTKRAESRLRDLLLESVALQLLSNADCDVLIVRPDEVSTASRAATA